MDGMLRPLGIGEMLDASIKLYRARFRDMLIAAALVTAPAVILVALVQVSAGNPTALTQTDPETNLPEVDFGSLWIYIASLSVTFVITLLANNLATAGVLRIISGTYLGEEIGWRDSLRFAFRRFWSLTWLLTLTALALVGGLLACIIPAFYVQGIWAVVLPVLLVEDMRGTKALGRSYRLVKGRFWPVLGTVLLGGLLASVVQGVLSAPVIALVFIEANFVLTAALQAVVNIIGTALTTPFVAVLTMVIYFDLRVRKEGFDLYLLAQRVGVSPPPGGFPAQPGTEQTSWGPPPPQWGAPAPQWGQPPQWSPPPAPPPPAPQAQPWAPVPGPPPPGWTAPEPDGPPRAPGS